MYRGKPMWIMLTILGLVLAGCQAVQPANAAEAEPESQPNQVRSAFEFSVPEWELQHGWVSIDMPLSETEAELAGGSVRWVEVNDDQQVRYVIAVPRCVSLSEDGQAALIAVEISDRWGWGEGDPGQWMQFWLNEAGHEFASPLWPPSDVAPGCEYAVPDQTIPLAAGQIMIGQPAFRATTSESFEGQPVGQRQIKGQFGFPSPEVWGVDLWITQEFDVVELDPQSHEATGILNWGVYDVEQREWKRIKSDVKYVLFDEPTRSAMVISQITEKTGPGDGEPGEYACFWVRDGEPADQFGIHYYSDFHPEVGFKEFFPADELPALEYGAPAAIIDVENGDLAIAP